MTEAEYLAFDASHEGRHEFINGELVSMAGGTEAHALATMNVGGWLRGALRGSSCRVYSSDLRVHLDETGLYAYPDVTVVCGASDLTTTNPPSVLNPRVIVEVLSGSTEAHDRGAKAAHYRQRASVEAIVFVSTETRRVEVLTRAADGTWILQEATSGEVPIPPLHIALPVDEVYAGFDELASGASANTPR
ncbi:MAG: Uma2 family endonuclease [Pseudomonadota bacterium]|nr:Uma2 family endonuclease [Pseudomonadota bacterium]